MLEEPWSRQLVLNISFLKATTSTKKLGAKEERATAVVMSPIPANVALNLFILL